MTETKATAVVEFNAPRLPYHSVIEERFGVTKLAWKALVEAVYPYAKTVDSVILVLSYCQGRKLDPFKRPVHIVPVWSAAANNGNGGMIDTVWPGISELRTTAMRTKLYAGCDEVEFGPTVDETFTWTDKSKRVHEVTVSYPEWGKMTVYRLVGNTRVPVVGPRTYWKETYATLSRWDEAPNEMWRKRPRGQLEKCAEAAALRRAFPEELGDEPTAEEMEGKAIGHVSPTPPMIEGPRPTLSAGFEEDARQEAPRTAEGPRTAHDATEAGEGAPEGSRGQETGEIIEAGAAPPPAEPKKRAPAKAKAPDLSDGFPGDGPPPADVREEEPPTEAADPMATVMAAIEAANSWPAIRDGVAAVAKTDAWKAFTDEQRDEIRRAAWARYSVVEQGTDIISDFPLFRLWVGVGATTAEEIDLMFPAFWKSPAYQSASKMDQASIVKLIGDRKIALKGEG